MHYIVLRVSDGKTVYEGESESLAAEALEVGMVYGKHPYRPESAYNQARDRMYKARKAEERAA